MAASWPSGLPYQVSAQAYAVQAAGLPPLASQAQSGRIRMRPQFTLRIARVAYGWEFTPAELGTWQAFLNDTLGQGTGEFTLPFWIERAHAYQPRTVTIRDGAGGVSEKKVAFDHTLVALVLDVRNL